MWRKGEGEREEERGSAGGGSADSNSPLSKNYGKVLFLGKL
jgi:hypothetical protein